MEKRKNVTRAFRLLGVVFGLTVISLISSSIRLYVAGSNIDAIYFLILAQLAAKFAEWYSFNGLRM